MNCLLLAMLTSLHFTAPADSVDVDAAGRLRVAPVYAYIFHRLDERGVMMTIPGYADSLGAVLLTPHAPGIRERVWLEAGAGGAAVTIYVMSRDRSGNVSDPSNGCVIGERSAPEALASRRAAWTVLDVPIVKRGRDRSGQAVLAMVLRYYGAAPAALREVDGAYDPVLRRSQLTDLAGAARRAGYDADVATLTPDLLVSLLNEGVPPILCYEQVEGATSARPFGVVTGWDAGRAAFTVHDGGARPRVTSRGELLKRWEGAGSQALIVRQRAP